MVRHGLILLLLTCVTAIGNAADINGQGFIAHHVQYTTRAEFPAVLEEVFVKEGDHVKQGDLLAVLRSDEVTLTVHRIKSARERAVADMQIAEASASLISARLSRMERLSVDGAVHKHEVHEAELQLEIEKLKLAQTKMKIDAITHELELRLRQEERLHVRAPFDGVISKVHATAGDVFVQPGAPLVAVARRGELVAKVYFDAGDIKLLSAESPKVTLYVEATNSDIPGELIEVSSTVDRRSRTIQTIIAFDDEHAELLRPGMVVHANLKE